MKKYLVLLVIAFGFLGCDDGDIAEVNYQFDNTNANACGANANDFFIYKTTDNRVAILKINPDYFKNIITQQPINLSIDRTSTSLLFRTYSDKISNNTICNNIPPATPIVTSESNAIGGDVSIVTTALKSSNEANGSTKIDGYLHTIYFNNITFETQRNESLPSITYVTRPIALANFSNILEISKCDNLNVFYKNNGSQSIVMELSQEAINYLFNNEIGVEKEVNLDFENKISQKIYDVSYYPLTSEYFCETTTPVNPPVIENWVSISGTISVSTQANANGYTHTVVLKNARLWKDELDVRLGFTFDLGKYYTE